MVMAALSPNSILASPAHVNPQVKADLQTSAPQVAQNAEKAAKTAQTDTITISPQALKMADSNNAAVKEAADKADEQRALQLARDKADVAKNQTQKKAVRAYAAVGANR
jgi:hypothetical protein